MPMMERMVVVLPMPLRPIRATISPERDRERQAEQHLAEAVAGLDAVDFEQRSAVSAMAGHRVLVAEIGALDFLVVADRVRIA